MGGRREEGKGFGLDVGEISWAAGRVNLHYFEPWSWLFFFGGKFKIV